MFGNLAKKVFGSANDRLVRGMHAEGARINALEADMQALSDEQLQAKTDEFRTRLKEGTTLDAILPEAFAVVREAGIRTLGMRHFDVQLVGGMVLALRTFPIIIISTRAALKSVPRSIADGALSVGATHTQAVFHHKLPLAAPGIMTGTIIGMAQALGETAPLLMIGMVAFIVEIPGSPLDPSTALPVQVYLWADSPERAFVARTSAAIIVLLAFLLIMNATAVWLRRRFERRW